MNTSIRVAHLASLLVAAVVLVIVNRGSWFFADEWNFVHRFLHPSVRVFLMPQNEHWVTLPLLIYRVLYAVVGLHSYWPYIFVLLVAHLLLAHVLWRLMLRWRTDPVLATALVALFAVLGAGAENLIQAFQMAFTLSVLFGYLLIAVVDRAPRVTVGTTVTQWGIAVLALMCSGVGISMVFAAGLVAFGRNGWRRALTLTSVPAIVFVLWFLAYGRQGLVGDSLTLTNVLEIPRFLWTGLVAALEGGSGVVGAGAVLVLVLLAVITIRSISDVRRYLPVMALTAAAILNYLIIGGGRTRLGVSTAASPRYIYVAIAMLLPAIGIAFSWLLSTAPGRQGLRLGRIAIVVFLCIAVVSNLDALRNFARVQHAAIAASRDQIFGGVSLVKQPVQLIGGTVEPRFAPDLTSGDLESLVRGKKFPAKTSSSLGGLLAAKTNLLFTSSTTPRFEEANAVAISGTSAATTTESGGCSSVHATENGPMLVLTIASNDSLTAVADRSASLHVTLRDDQTNVRGPTVSVPMLPARTIYLNFSQDQYDALITVSSGTTLRLCGVAPVNA